MLALAFAAGLAPAGTSHAEDCRAWPGEFSPLPTVDAADPFAAHWARLRVSELSGVAAELESDDPVEAHRLWRRVLCLAPADEAALAAVERTRPRVVVSEPTVPRREDGAVAAVESAVARAESLIFDARFRDALAAVDRGRRQAGRAEDSPDGRQALARLEVLAATAWVALREDDAARASFERALARQPGLELDAATTPPKVRRAFEAVRLDGATPDEAHQRTSSRSDG